MQGLKSEQGAETPGPFTLTTAQFQGEPIQRDVKYTEVGKICNFRPKLPIISETVRDRPMVAITER